jgi:hypothetical protein
MLIVFIDIFVASYISLLGFCLLSQLFFEAGFKLTAFETEMEENS